MSIIKEFKEFAMRGNVMDLAIGIILGAAFGLIVNSLVNDIIMPPVGLVAGKIDFSQKRFVLHDAPDGSKVDATGLPAGEVSIRYGRFINAIINFVIVAFAIFLVVKGINRLRRKEAAAPSEPPAPTREEILLAEIRDAVRSRGV